jgi:hypothetical protein
MDLFKVKDAFGLISQNPFVSSAMQLSGYDPGLERTLDDQTLTTVAGVPMNERYAAAVNNIPGVRLADTLIDPNVPTGRTARTVPTMGQRVGTYLSGQKFYEVDPKESRYYQRQGFKGSVDDLQSQLRKAQQAKNIPLVIELTKQLEQMKEEKPW